MPDGGYPHGSIDQTGRPSATWSDGATGANGLDAVTYVIVGACMACLQCCAAYHNVLGSASSQPPNDDSEQRCLRITRRNLGKATHAG